MAGKCTRPRRIVNGKRGKDTFIAIPMKVMMSESYRTVSLTAKALLAEFCFRYNGQNNGDLSMPFTSVKHWGCGSDRRLNKALKELQEADLIKMTRKGKGGHGGNMPHLYALTWLPVNEIKGKPDIKSGPALRVRFEEASTYES
jgi:hypothetical protein